MKAYKVVIKPWKSHPSVKDVVVIIANNIKEAADKICDDAVSIELIGELLDKSQ